jgi:hypothetical protein
MADISLDTAQKALQLYEQRRKEQEATLESIEKERNLMAEVAKQAKLTNIEYDRTTKSFGKNIEKLSTIERLEAKIGNHQLKIHAIESELHDGLELRGKLTESIEKGLIAAEERRKELKREKIALEKSLLEVMYDETTNEEEKIEIYDSIQKKLKNIQETRDSITKQLKDEKQTLIKHDATLAGLNDKLNSEVGIRNKLKASLEHQHKLTGLTDKILSALPGRVGAFIKGLNAVDIALLSIIGLIGKGVSNFLHFDKSATQLRKELGLIRGEADGLEKNIMEITKESADMGVKFEDVAHTTKALSVAFTSLVAKDKELVRNTTLLATQLGISAEESAGFLRTMGGISRTTASSNTSMIGYAKAMSNAAGVPLANVMHDVATASDEARIYTKGTAQELIKAVVEARLLGTTLDRMAATSRMLLDFQSSIENELEASVMLGKNLNFQRARELAFHKDIIGANKEILKISKQVDFSNMNPMQMEAFAKAAGKSVAELQDMIQADKNIEWIQKNGTKEQREQLSNLQRLKNLRESEAKDVGKIAIAELQRQSNQEKIAAVQDKFNKLILELTGPVMEITDVLLTAASYTLPFLLKGVLPIIGAFKMLSRFAGDLTPKLIPFISKFSSVGGFFGNLILKAGEFFKSIGTIFKFAKLGLKGVPLLGEVIIAFEAVISLTKVFKKLIPDMFNDFKEGNWGKALLKGLGSSLLLGPKLVYDILIKPIFELLSMMFPNIATGIVNGIKSVGKSISDSLTGPFKDAWDWISEFFVGHSPSKLGLGILNGIVSIGGMLLNAITAPFTSAFNFVSGMFGGPKVPKPSDMIGGLVNKGNTDLPITATKKEAVDTNKVVVDKLDELIGLMKSGGIAVNIDGNRISYFLTKNTMERGGLGATS